MNKLIKKKKSLEMEIRQLKSEIFMLSCENVNLDKKLMGYKAELNTLRQAQERHENICSENVQVTNAEFGKIRQELNQLKKPFWKR